MVSMAEEAEQMRSQIQSLSAGIDGVPDIATEMIKQAKRAGPQDFEVVNNAAKRRGGGGGGSGSRRAKRGAMEMTAPLSLSHPQPGGGGGGGGGGVGKSASGAESDGGGKSKRRPFAGESHTDTETEVDGGAGGHNAKMHANAAAAERMRIHIAELETRVKDAEEDRALAESAVTARDREVKRLGQLLEQGRDSDALHAEHAHQTNQKIIEQLNLQVGGGR